MIGLELEGQVVLVSGGASGIGAAVVEVLLQVGGRPVVFDREPANLDPAAVLTIQGDVTDEKSVDQVVDAAVARFGRIDALVHCAGITSDAVHWKMSDDQWRHVLDVNLTGGFGLLRRVVPIMRCQGGGAVVLVASINALRGKFGQANYCASKAGLLGLMRSAARETGSFGIRVNAVAPGLVDTKMSRELPEAVREAAVRETALGRIAAPEDVAWPIAFLCSPRSRHVTGTVLRVDGGQCMAG